MKLIPASEAAFADLNFWVRSVSVVKIYYVWTGRNAWWYTWSTKYSPGCFHSTFESARTFCENSRVQGTVFYIDELPSLALHGSDCALVVSEINTQKFLSKLDLERLKSIIEILPVSTMTLRQMYFVFRAKSSLWTKGYPQKDSATISFASGDGKLTTIVGSEELSSHKSSSTGSRTHLHWEKRPFTKDHSILHRLAKMLVDRISEH